MSLSAMPSAFARAISLPALAARSCCAAVAVLSFDSTPTEISARSGFLDTSPSPLVITPGSNVDVPVVADEADGAASNIEGRLTTASTASVAMAAENATVRRVDGMFCRSSCRANATTGHRVTGRLDSGESPEPAWRIQSISSGEADVEVVVAQDDV